MSRITSFLLFVLVIGLGIIALPSGPEAACYNTRINNKGSGGAAITIDNTTGGVPIVDAVSARCGFTIINKTSNPINCAPSTGPYPLVVSATVGLYVPANVYPVLGTGGQQAWKCFQAGASSATVTISEDMP